MNKGIVFSFDELELYTDLALAWLDTARFLCWKHGCNDLTDVIFLLPFSPVCFSSYLLYILHKTMENANPLTAKQINRSFLPPNNKR